jgi:hypothetical protein
MRTSLLAVALVSAWTLGCSGDDRGESALGDFCQAYADQCPAEPDLAECNMECANGTDPAAGDCWFKACATITGKCDNEEMGDPSITLCAIDRGWTDASGGCSNLADYCSSCPPARVAECDSLVSAGDDRACIEHLVDVQDC